MTIKKKELGSFLERGRCADFKKRLRKEIRSLRISLILFFLIAVLIISMAMKPVSNHTVSNQKTCDSIEKQDCQQELGNFNI